EAYQHVEEDVLFKQTQEQLMQTIQRLPPQCQKVFILFKLEGRSYQEICQMLKISKSTVNNHLTKANRLLKEQLPYYQNQAVMACILLFKDF
ncbi:MAG: sigma-70 family RNA polymerase sigma factor, partial [Sphingobacterium sp.]